MAIKLRKYGPQRVGAMAVNQLATGILSRDRYWSVVPPVCRQLYNIGRRDAFKTLFVNPNTIERTSYRTPEHPDDMSYPGYERRYHFGAQIPGDWDITSSSALHPGHKKFYYGDVFEDSLIFQALKQRFEKREPWEQTKFIQEFREDVSKYPGMWGGSYNDEDIFEKCEKLESVYESLQEHGYRTQRELDDTKSFIDCVAGEILVDVGRDGSFQIVEGRHRVAMTKLLDFEEIPVIPVVIHADFEKELDKIESVREKVRYEHVTHD